MSDPAANRAAALIAQLQLHAHPEGGHYRRIHPPAATPARPRPAWSAVQFLLRAGQCSAWHRVDADESWYYAEGAELELLIYDPADRSLQCRRLGPLSADGLCCPMRSVPAGCWQAARSLGAYTLVTCQVVPAFEFAGFQLLDAATALAADLRRRAPQIG